MAEGEHHHRHDQPEGFPERRITPVHRLTLAEIGEAPLWQQIDREANQKGNHRQCQHADGRYNDLFASQQHQMQTQHHPQHQQAARQLGIPQLVHHKALDRIGDGDAVDQNDGVEGHQIDQHQQLARLGTEVLLHHMGDIPFPMGAGEHKAAQCPVGIIRERESQQ